MLNYLGKFCDCFEKGKLSVNFSKFNKICFSKKKATNGLRLQGKTLFDKDKVFPCILVYTGKKYFGVHINKKLAFKT